MEPALLSLTAASIAFVGTHFALSHPLRAPLVGMVGEKGFPAIYSLVALATFIWMVLAFRAAPSPDLPGSGEFGWIAVSVITIPAIVLWLGSFKGNPAMPMPGAEKAAQAEPSGVFRVTRHPMMWSFALWAVSHLILFWSMRTLIVASAVLFLALVGAKMQDRKKQALMGEAWIGWESRTSYWPKWSALFGVGWGLWLIAIAVWLLFSWLHIPVADVPAGVWRWF
ncbi:NnrU family protein [Altererythrobacter sp. MF3-039]|uniref:NnrU family protein n=1 Tax=Altererythrobacter sp. MF3-039 TaxID=3252901 RepID=UPI00390C8E69